MAALYHLGSPSSQAGLLLPRQAAEFEPLLGHCALDPAAVAAVAVAAGVAAGSGQIVESARHSKLRLEALSTQ